MAQGSSIHPIKKDDPELRAGSSAHYDDPAYYTKTYKKRVEDVRYYVDLAVKSGGPVLELGCGNGRISIPIARHGIAISGVDLSEEMLADLETRLGKEPVEVRRLVTFRHGDMRSARLKKRFPLVICPFNAFMHLYTREDVEEFLATVLAHLTKDGELVIDFLIPDPESLARDPGRAYFSPRFRYPEQDKRGPMIRYSERFEYDRMRQIMFVAMQFEPVGGGESWMTPLAHRQFFPREVEALLHYNGFEVTAMLGDFTGRAPDDESASLVVHAKRRQRFKPSKTSRANS